MTTATEPTTEEAFWLAIGAAPEDQLPRLVFADWLEERAKVVECNRCGGKGKLRSGMWLTHWSGCPTCTGTGYIPDRNGRLAAALRATADRVPFRSISDLWCFFGHAEPAEPDELAWGVRMALNDARRMVMGFPTATDAIRDLCEAWCKVTYGEVGE